MGGPGTKFEAVLFKWISSPNQISDVHNHKRCSIRYSSVSIIRAAKVCSGQPGCVTTGACAASTWTCWTSFWPASSSMAQQLPQQEVLQQPQQGMLQHVLTAPGLEPVTLKNFENRAKFWKWGKILKMGQNFGNGAKFWNLGKILKNGQNFENLATFWKSGKILKIGHNFENVVKLRKLGKI